MHLNMKTNRRHGIMNLVRFVMSDVIEKVGFRLALLYMGYIIGSITEYVVLVTSSI